MVFFLSVACAALQPSVLCIGECLFDGLPSGIFLGGAPLNAAVHLQQRGVKARFASAIGADRLGREASRRLTSAGVDVSLLATIEEAETGFVEVDIDPVTRDASYSFATPAAWDLLRPDGIAEAASTADAVVFGTLGQRAELTRSAIQAASDAARYSVCDINLRPPFDDAAIVAAAAAGVSLLKLNDEEITPVAEALRRASVGDDGQRWRADAACAAAASVEAAAEASDAAANVVAAVAAAAAALGRAADASAVVVTRGAEGAVYWSSDAPGVALSCAGFRPPDGVVVDSVGAGDGFLAAFLAAFLQGLGAQSALEAGCRIGAFVAGQSGATPEHDAEQIEKLQANAQPIVARLSLVDE